MSIVTQIFGADQQLTTLQMAARALLVFPVCLVLIRVSGRRSFGIRSPLDNIIVIMLGAVLSRAIIGASPFIPVVAACFTLVLLHRFLGWLVIHSKPFARIVEGKKILLYKDGQFIKENLNKALLCEEDVMQGVRESALTNDLKKISLIFIERNGEISVVKEEAP